MTGVVVSWTRRLLAPTVPHPSFTSVFRFRMGRAVTCAAMPCGYSQQGLEIPTLLQQNVPDTESIFVAVVRSQVPRSCSRYACPPKCLVPQPQASLVDVSLYLTVRPACEVLKMEFASSPLFRRVPFFHRIFRGSKVPTVYTRVWHLNLHVYVKPTSAKNPTGGMHPPRTTWGRFLLTDLGGE